MSILQISKIQVRRGKKKITGIPQLSSGEFGWAVDTRELYIGNGSVSEGAPYVGNTKILTEHDNIIDFALFYEYKKNDTSMITGYPLPVSRSFQDRLDDQVSVKSFGVAALDGSVDYTDQMQRAIDQIFINPATKDLESSKVVLEIPAGVFTISKPLKIPSYANIKGAGKHKTIIKQIGTGPVFETVSSKSIPSNGIVPGTYYVDNFDDLPPKFINVSSLTFRHTVSNQSVGIVNSTRESLFDNVSFEGIWDSESNEINSNESCLKLTAASSGNINYSSTNNLFNNCDFRGMSYAVFSNYDIEFNNFNNCLFENCGKGIVFGTNIIGIPGSISGPNNNRISNSVFKNINQQGILIIQGTGNISHNNKFLAVGNELGNSGTAAYPVIESGQSGNVSDNDYFERSVDLTSGFEFLYNSTQYIGEYAGHIVGNHKFNTSITVSNNSGVYSPLLKLSGFMYNPIYQITEVNSVNYELTYVYQSSVTNIIRSGVLYISLNNQLGNVTITDEYNFTGDSSLAENLKFSGKEIIITIDDNESFQKEKLDLMKKAATDALFLKDIEDTVSDFEERDFESTCK